MRKKATSFATKEHIFKPYLRDAVVVTIRPSDSTTYITPRVCYTSKQLPNRDESAIGILSYPITRLMGAL